MIQLRIIHLSDVHFGPHHRCNPEDPTHPRAGYPSLFDLIAKDLGESVFAHDIWRPGEFPQEAPLIVVISGDITESADPKEFAAAQLFLSRFDGATLLATKLTRNDLYVVPGNHDIAIASDDAETRLAPYTNFYSKVYRGVRPPITPDNAEALSQIHVRKDHGFIVAEINSSYYVQRSTSRHIAAM
jgi:3',5'-cyclic AMP phosphodiesterase CpdA